MDFGKMVKPELASLIPVLYLIGMALRASRLANKWIPLLLGGAGILLAAAYLLAFAPELTFLQAAVSGVTQGVLAAGAAVYADQLVKQSGRAS